MNEENNEISVDTGTFTIVDTKKQEDADLDTLIYLSDDLRIGDAPLLSEPCVKCGQTGVPSSPTNRRICLSCDRAMSKRYAVERKKNDGWQEISVQQGLELWERQPSETSLEWQIWQRYCSYYPGRIPPLTHIAQELQLSPYVVSTAAQRWNYKVRIQAWARHTDALTVQTRVDAVKEMHQEHISLAKMVNQKLRVAIEQLNPALMKPSEIASLLKVSSELEKKAQTHVDEKVPNEGLASGAHREEKLTKREDVNEVISVLGSLGLLGGGPLGPIGIKTTTETQIVVNPGPQQTQEEGDDYDYTDTNDGYDD